MAVLDDTALLITASRDLSVALGALLLSIPPLRRVERVSGPNRLLQRLSGGRQPALVVVDAATPGANPPDLIATLRAVAPETRCLVLSNTVAESRALASSGIEPVVVKGADPSRLVDTIAGLLGEGEEAPLGV